MRFCLLVSLSVFVEMRKKICGFRESRVSVRIKRSKDGDMKINHSQVDAYDEIVIMLSLFEVFYQLK